MPALSLSTQIGVITMARPLRRPLKTELASDARAVALCRKLQLVEHDIHIEPLRLLVRKGYSDAQIIAGYTLPIFAD